MTVFLLFALPQHFLAEAVARRFLETWFQPVATVGGNLAFYGIPLLAVIGGFYLVRVEEVTLKEVVARFAVGGVAYGIGIASVSWTGTAVSLRPTATEYAILSACLWGRFVGAALFGALGATFANRRWQPPSDAYSTTSE